MLRAKRNVALNGLNSLGISLCYHIACPVRSISINSGINKGLRQTARESDRKSSDGFNGYSRGNNKANAAIRMAQKDLKARRDEASASNRRRPHTPIHVHYTTAESQFIRDQRTIVAMLKNSRRQLHKLYISETADASSMATWKRLARVKNVQSNMRRQADMQALDSALFDRSQGGVSCILECSPPVEPPLLALEAHGDKQSRTLRFQTTSHSMGNRQREGTVRQDTVELSSVPAEAHRYPFVIWLHGVKNIGNIGAIFRSAAYFGVDAILLSEKLTGSLTPGVLDASVGSSDAVPTYRIRHPLQFLSTSQRNGWRFIAAAAGPGSRRPESHQARHPLQEAPTVIMLGDEHVGLDSRELLPAVDGIVTIPGQSRLARSIDLDSLNVSVAGAILIERFLRNTSEGGESAEWAKLIKWKNR